MLKRYLLSFLAIILVFILIEGAFRAYDYGFKYKSLEQKLYWRKAGVELSFEELLIYLFKTGKCVRDPKLIWRYSPKIGNPEINSLGIRTAGAKELVCSKDNSTYRIIIFGGSHPFGAWLPYRETYAYKLERIFAEEENELKRRVEVINAAVPGYSTTQVLNFLKYYMVDYDPDLIIIDAGNNDGIPLTSRYPISDNEAVKINPFICKAFNFLDRSSFVWYYREFLYRLTRSIAKEENKNIDGGRLRVSEKENSRNLNEMKEMALKKSCKILFLSQVRLDDEGNLKRGFGAIVEPYLDIYAQLKKKTSKIIL